MWMELGVATIVENNMVTGFSVVSRDITTRKNTEIKLAETTNLLKMSQDVGHIGSFKYNIQNDTVAWSDKLYEIYGVYRNTI